MLKILTIFTCKLKRIKVLKALIQGKAEEDTSKAENFQESLKRCSTKGNMSKLQYGYEHLSNRNVKAAERSRSASTLKGVFKGEHRPWKKDVNQNPESVVKRIRMI